MEAVGLCSALILTCDLIGNTGHVLAKDAGAVEVTNSKLLNRGTGAEIEAKDCGSIVSFCHDSVANKHGADITATDFGTILFDDDKIANKHGSTIQASLGGLIKIDHSEIINKHDSFITAGVGGDITLADDRITNTGASFIEAKGDDSVVYLEHSFVDNCDGTIAAIGCDANVVLINSTIVGGTLETRDGGVIETIAGPGGHHTTSTFENLTNKGYVLVQSNTTLALEGTIHNDGTIVVDPESGRGADLRIDGTVFLDGSGTVELDGRHDKITGGPDGGALINHSTIDGFGQIGTGNDDLTLHNKADGTVNADIRHETLIVDTGCNTITNAGLMEATKGGILDIESDVANAGGKLEALRFSTVILDHIQINDGKIEAIGRDADVELKDATIVGGDLVTGNPYLADGGVIETVTEPDGHHSTSTFEDLTNKGYVLVQSNTTLALEGTIHNDGTILVDPESGRGADLQIDGKVFLDGSGTVELDGRNDKITGGPDGGTLINNSTIAGFGQIGDGDRSLTFDNQRHGVVDATGLLVIDTGRNAVENDGHLNAICDGTLDIKSDVENSWGTIGAYGADALVQAFGVTITGGTLATGDLYWRDDGVIEVVATRDMTEFDGSQSHDPLTIAGFVQVDPGAQLELKGTIDLPGGAIELDEATIGHHTVGAQLVIDGTVTLTGYGDVALEGNDTGIVGEHGTNATLYNDASIIGSRGGYIGTGDNSLTFINHGTVDSEAGHAGPLVIDTGDNPVINTHVLEATGASELDLYGTYQNAGGTIGAYADGSGPSVVKLFDATIQGGTLATDPAAPGGSMIEITGNGTSVFDGSSGHDVTINGYVQVDAGSNLELHGNDPRPRLNRRRWPFGRRPDHLRDCDARRRRHGHA